MDSAAPVTNTVAPAAGEEHGAPAASLTGSHSDAPKDTAPASAATADDEHNAEAEQDTPGYEPIMKLEKVATSTLEEDEIPIFKQRAKLFRFDAAATEWKERGTGDMRLMMHTQTGKVRVLMRRDKILKICANHYISNDMKLQNHAFSERAVTWNVGADISDGEATSEVLAVRFKSKEICVAFCEKFSEAKKWNAELASGSKQPDDPSRPTPDPDAGANESNSDAAASSAPVSTSAVEAPVVEALRAVESTLAPESTPAVETKTQEATKLEQATEDVSAAQATEPTAPIVVPETAAVAAAEPEPAPAPASEDADLAAKEEAAP